ncbi:MAG: secretion system protein [Chloroflexi bacterium]|nr:secretion system protein [Chloroflexota bacterium]
MGTELMIAGGAGVVAIFILIAGVVSMRSERQQEIEERLERYTTEYDSTQASGHPQDPDEAAAEVSLLTARLDSALSEREFAQKWRVQLARADLKLTVAEYFSLHIISGLGVFLVAWFIIFGNPIAGGAAGVAGLFIPRFYVARKQGQRLRAFEAQLPDTIALWVNALRSGYSVMQAMEAISKEAPEPTATEFRRVVQEVQLGVPMEASLDHLLNRMPSEDMDLVNTAVNIQREVGGNLAEILEAIAHTIRERIKLKGEIRVLTSQGRITGWLISLLPIILTMFLMVVSPGYMGGLVENRMCGWPMLGIGLGLIGTGAAIIQKIVSIDY